LLTTESSQFQSVSPCQKEVSDGAQRFGGFVEGGKLLVSIRDEVGRKHSRFVETEDNYATGFGEGLLTSPKMGTRSGDPRTTVVWAPTADHEMSVGKPGYPQPIQPGRS
jgi:hypothetical protein